jgi:TolB-like protein/tetratricopeptide (TPR) repeat protein
MKLLAELKRRNVPRMAALYLVTAWLVMQVIDVVIDLTPLPDAYGQVVLAVLAVGLPIALILSWLTPEGISKEATAEGATQRATGRRSDFIIIAVLGVALALFIYIDFTRPPIERSVAVLPFVNLSGDPTQDYFSDGMAEEVRHQLTQFDDLKVIARLSSEGMRGMAIATVASKLKVGHVLEGSVQQSGQRVRITAQLVDATRSSPPWSRSYDRDLTTDGLFEIQIAIATAIAKELHVKIPARAKAHMVNAPTQNMEAYRLYLLGRERLARDTTTAYDEALRYLEQAIELDPEFAAAYVALAYVEPDEQRTRDLIDKALQLDDSSGEAHAFHARNRYTQDAEAELAEFEYALQLSPQNAEIYALYGHYLTYVTHDNGKALEIYARGIELNPLHTMLIMSAGWSLNLLNRPEEAFEYYKRAIEIDPEHVGSYNLLGGLYWSRIGRLDEAMLWVRRGYAIDPEDGQSNYITGFLYLDLGDDVAAEQWFQHLLALKVEPQRARSYLAKVGLADVYDLRGQTDESLALLEELYRSGRWIGTGQAIRERLLGRYLTLGRYDEAARLIQQADPELFETHELTGEGDLGLGMKLAQLLDRTGKKPQAQELWRRLEQYREQIGLGWGGRTIGTVTIYEGLGQTEAALQALRDEVDGGWRFFWRETLIPGPESIRDDPRFLKIVAEVEADIAQQLEHVREMELSGELAPMQPVPP